MRGFLRRRNRMTVVNIVVVIHGDVDFLFTVFAVVVVVVAVANVAGVILTDRRIRRRVFVIMIRTRVSSVFFVVATGFSVRVVASTVAVAGLFCGRGGTS